MVHFFYISCLFVGYNEVNVLFKYVYVDINVYKWGSQKMCTNTSSFHKGGFILLVLTHNAQNDLEIFLRTVKYYHEHSQQI